MLTLFHVPTPPFVPGAKNMRSFGTRKFPSIWPFHTGSAKRCARYVE